jgi:hypothetical protein
MIGRFAKATQNLRLSILRSVSSASRHHCYILRSEAVQSCTTSALKV